MSETKWSPEPWRRGNYAIRDADDVAVMPNNKMADADERRMLACVNACAGIPTEALEAGAMGRALDLFVETFVPPHPEDRCRPEVDCDPDCLQCRAITLLCALGRLK